MLSPKTQTNLKNAKAYFEEHLALGEYYAQDGRIAGQWIGHGARLLELSGPVKKDDFLKLCENHNPVTGERLTQRFRRSRQEAGPDGRMLEVADRRVFFDFTFSPPKSVSIAALVIGDERIRAAHREAVRGAVGRLEQFAGTRVRRAGINQDRRTGILLAALFEHDTSRALDPHLHTHCVVFNATWDPVESRWKALQNFEILRAQKFVENVYYHELARELRRFGYEIVNAARGDFQIGGIREALCERLSKRHRQIDAWTRELIVAHPEKASENIAEIREHLAHKSRAWKARELPLDQLRTLWNEQLSPAERESLVIPRFRGEGNSADSPGSPQSPQKQNRGVGGALDSAEAHLFERRSVVAEHEIWRYALEFGRGGDFPVYEVMDETRSRAYLRDGTGRVTRPEVLARELRIVQMARDGARACGPILEKLPPLDASMAADQQRACDRILCSRGFVTLFRGGAGTGKSYVLRCVQEAVAAEGLASVVLAPQRQQVIDLEKDGLRNASTVAHFLEERSLPKGAVVIVDEAGQIGAGQMLSLLEIAAANEGRVVLSGDTRQHGPVETSDALRAIERHSGLQPAELNTIRRQDPKRAANAGERERIRQYRQAIKEASEGDLAASFDRLDQNGAVIQCAQDTMAAAVADAFAGLATKGQSALVVSQPWASIEVLNESIRERLRERGLLSGQEKIVDAFERIDLSASQKCDARFYPEDHVVVFNRRYGSARTGEIGRLFSMPGAGPVVELGGQRLVLVRSEYLDAVTVCRRRALALTAGDRLQLKANARTPGGAKFANGEIVTVARVGRDGAIKLKDGRRLPAGYRQFVRGYAVTSYGSQGKTVDHVLLADAGNRAATNAQQWYVSVSRGRRSVQVFTTDKAKLREEIGRSGDRPLAIEMDLAELVARPIRRGVFGGLQRGRAMAMAVAQMVARPFRHAPSHGHKIEL